MSLPSAKQIGDQITLHGCGAKGTVVAVKFTASKVTYDIDFEAGGETAQNIDPAFVQ